MTTPDLPQDPSFARFFSLIEAGLANGTFVKALLAKPRHGAGDLLRVTARRVSLKGEDVLSLVHTHRTRDVTVNLGPHDGMAALRELLAHRFHNAHLFTRAQEARPEGGQQETQLAISQKGRCTLRAGKPGPVAPAVGTAPPAATPAAAHDRQKRRWIDVSRPFLAELGVTTAQGELIPAMSRKWKQINKFVEIFAGALASSALADAQALNVVDFGSGKGYLTFAVHDWLRHTRGIGAQVAGVELRPDMVALCNQAISRLRLEGLRMVQGDVRDHDPGRLDVMIALHACDTATDHAIHLGVRAGAGIIMCSPCCHKQLRPQLLSPHPLAPILRHGVHLGQQAEMLTDGLRAMLLEACGYDTQVFEFVSLEHSQKNKMILAVKRAQARAGDDTLRQIREVKAFYRIQEQCLETLLRADGVIA